MVLVPTRSQSAADDAAEPDLLIDRFEVTDGEFAAFLKATGYRPADLEGFLSHWRSEEPRGRAPPLDQLDLPVRHVSQADALAYAHWRQKELPTIDEWLRACPSLAAGALPWLGRAFAGACNSVSSGLHAPMPVGSYELGRSPTGCYDMVGNVREWTSSEAAFSSEKVDVLGGSFQQGCEPDGFAHVDPWLDRVAPAVRADDLGFRCVVRDARPVLEEALAGVDGLEGDAREQAIAELVRVGERTYGPNAVVQFVRERAFERRVRWSDDLTVAESSPLRGDRVELVGASDDGDELFVASESALLRLARSDGSVLKRIDAPFPDGSLQRDWIVAPGGSKALWWEGRRGEVALVEMPAGRVRRVDAPPEPRSVAARWLVQGPAPAHDAWVVQQLELLESEESAPAHAPDFQRARVARIAADGTQERTLPGRVLFGPAPAGPDGLLLVLHHSLDVVLPMAAYRPASARREEGTVSFVWWSLELVRPADVVPASRWFVVGDGRFVDLPAPVASALPTTLRWWHWRFVPENERDGAAVDFDVPEDLLRLLEPTTRPASCLVDAGIGRWLLVDTHAGTIVPPRFLTAPGEPATAFRLLPADADEPHLPYLLSEDGSALYHLRDDGHGLERVASGLAIPAALAWAGVNPAQTHLVLRTRDGQWFGIDLEHGRLAFSLQLPEESSFNQGLLAVGGGSVLAGQTTTTSAWMRSTDDGRPLDEFGVARPPIRQVLATAPKGGGANRPEPIVLFDDGRLVALGPPEAASARMVKDFLDVARGSGVATDAMAARGGR